MKIHNYGGRQYGDDDIIEKRFINNNSISTRENTDYKTVEICSDFCSKIVIDNFTSFLENSNSKYNANDLKIIIGHCPQNYLSWEEKHATSLTNIEYEDQIKQILTGPAENDKYNSKKNLIFGITMECPYNHDPNNNEYKIYKVDIGSSRAFDQHEAYNITKNIEDEKKYLFSRTPQVLEFINNNAKIIKSQQKNTRIHQPRYTYEKLIINNNIAELKLESGNYKNKYLKYKNKYLQLKLNKNIN
jgi:hypothetical protein